MSYIVCERFNKKGIDGNFNLPVGTEIQKVGNVLYHNDKAVCFATSQNAYDYFSRNDDGHGSERFALVQEIKSKIAEYVSDYNEEIAAINNGDLTDEQKEEEIANVVDKCGLAYAAIRENNATAGLLHQDFNVWNFNFYNADLSILTQVKNLINNI